MHCPRCSSTATTTRKLRTALGYRRFNCRVCGRRFNERTGTQQHWVPLAAQRRLFAQRWRSLIVEMAAA